jgi:zinc protease
MEGVERYHLANGLEVLLKPDRRWPVVSAHVWIKVGSVDEVDERAGLAHILEHMVFKGTRRFTAEQIARRVEGGGGHMNAETSREYTHYYIDTPAAGGLSAVDILGELTYRAVLDPVEWSRECPVIQEEMKRRVDDPEVHLWDLFQDAIFEHPTLSRPVIGTARSVQAATVQDIAAFYRAHYTAGQSVVSVAGDFAIKDMRRQIEKTFRTMPAGDAREPRVRWAGTEAPGPRQALRVRTAQQRVRQIYSAIGFRTPPGDHPDQEALDLLAEILSYGRNSRLIQTLREKKRLVSSVSAMNYTQEGPGFFGVFAECEPEKQAAYTTALNHLIAQFVRRGPTAKEIQRAKNAIQTSWWQGWETMHNQASALGHHALDGQLDRFEQSLPKLMALKSKELHRVAKRYLTHPMGAARIEP